MACPHCPCAWNGGAAAHALLGLLAADDVDAALERGLLDAVACPACPPDCNARLAAARDARLSALAARERHRARTARQQRRKAEREATRRPQPSAAPQAPALPAAAADALARALARARERRG